MNTSKKMAIIYRSVTGKTEHIAETIRERFGAELPLKQVFKFLIPGLLIPEQLR